MLNKFLIKPLVISFSAVVFTAASVLVYMSLSGNPEINAGAPSEQVPDAHIVIAPGIPNNVKFCGEDLPLHDIEVYERLDNEMIVTMYRHSLTLLYFKRAARFFPVIEPILEKNGIPDDMKYLSVIESNLSNAVSPKGASGFWQFMEATGKIYGLEINKFVDERYHLEKSTEAACQYLKDSYNKYGSWAMAAASYNMGQAGVERQQNRQKEYNYYDLLLNDETSRYVFRIAAAKIIMENPRDYGYNLKPEDLYPPFRTKEVTVDQSVKSLIDFSKEHRISYKLLKRFNPWLRDTTLPVSAGKSYTINIPDSGSIYLYGKED